MYRFMDGQQHFQNTLMPILEGFLMADVAGHQHSVHNPCALHTPRLVVYPVLPRYPLSVEPLQDADEDRDPSRVTETPRHTKTKLTSVPTVQNPKSPTNLTPCYTHTHTHITFSLRPPAIDFQALPISDDQTIDELRSISRPTAPGISAAPCVPVCVLVQLCL